MPKGANKTNPRIIGSNPLLPVRPGSSLMFLGFISLQDPGHFLGADRRG